MLRLLRSHPTTYWVAAGLLALLTAGTSWLLLRRAEDAQRAWGTQRVVPVMTRPVLAGARLTDADVVERPLPTALIPQAPVADDPVGHLAAAPLAVGEVVLRARLVDGTTLPADAVVVTLATDRLGEPPPPGTAVVLIGAGEAGPPARGTVVGVTESAVTIAVPLDDAIRLAPSLRSGDIVLAVG